MSLLTLFAQSGGAPAEVTSTATWTQAAGAWAATATESIPATASFTQPATWAAAGTEAIPATIAFAQSASWSAVAEQADSSITSTASFVQSIPVGFVVNTNLLIAGYASPEPPLEWLTITGRLP